MVNGRRQRGAGTTAGWRRGLGGWFCVAVLLGAVPVPSEAPIADAAMRGDAEEVRLLLRRGADVNAPQGDGMTGLHWAAKNGDAEVAAMLLDAGAFVEVVTRLGDYRPLHLAARTGSAEVVDLLLSFGADPLAVTSTGGATALHFAAVSGNEGSAGALIDRGAPVDARESAMGQTPLMWAAAAGRTDVVRTLLAAGADPALTTRVADVAARAVTDRAERLERNARVRASRQAVAWSEPQRGGATAGPPPLQVSEPPETPEAATPALRREGPSLAEPEEEQRQIEEPEPLTYGELVGGHGGLTALLYATREGHSETALALLEGGAAIDQVSEGDHTAPILMAMVNGHFDLAMRLLEEGADPTIASAAGATPLYAALNAHWAPKSRYPQQHAHKQQETTYLEVMKALLDGGADPNARLTKHLWYMSYNFDLLQVDTKGATPFWRAAYATDVAAMRLLVAHGADPNVPTQRVPDRRRRSQGDEVDHSGVPPVPVGGPAVYPIHAASGVGYGLGFAANSHRHVPDGWLPAVEYLVEELGLDVNQRDHQGYTALHHAASRGDNELILYLVEHGAEVRAVSRRGQTTADMANGPVQRTQPFPETVELLESLGSENNHNCVSC